MHIVSRQPSKPRHDRVAPLAVLPVFFDLAGKRVVAIGGSEAATWKIELLAAAAAKEPGDADLAYDQAMMAEKMGNLAEMERLLRQVMTAKPDYHHAYNALGYSFAERGVRLPEARDLIKKALEFAPDDPFITDSLGWVEFRMGNKTEALRILEGAYKTRPDAEIAAHLGEVLWSLGQRDRAQQVWREGLLADNENETLLETLKRLRVKP